ncbi:hypothetical protein OS493_027959 [Desmophyllum pertusum]|uniref:Uncharacterized protein n=1 Tax=Desmophyllum pertusum TaxID=174260 RepID=A0A9W9YAV3_9CNID|nr:hypothetical protein OS493_027959 [Desmophyllum pertusum]
MAMPKFQCMPMLPLADEELEKLKTSVTKMFKHPLLQDEKLEERKLWWEEYLAGNAFKPQNTMWPVGVLRQKRVAQNSADVSMAREATDGLEHAEVEMPMVRRRSDSRIELKKLKNFLHQHASLDETEDRANQFLLKLERNLKSYKDLLEQLQEASKEDEAKIQRLENEMEEFSILALDGDETMCDLKLLVTNIAKRKQDTTEKEEKQKERAHERELQMEKLQTREGTSVEKNLIRIKRFRWKS